MGDREERNLSVYMLPGKAWVTLCESEGTPFKRDGFRNFTPYSKEYTGEGVFYFEKSQEEFFF
jgi:hypothetical protein